MNTHNAQTTGQPNEKPAFTKSDLGCIIDESHGSADECNARTIDFARDYGFDPGELPDEENEDYSQILSEAGDEAVDFLNDLERPSFCSFYFEDNSLYFLPSIEMAREDVGFVSGGEDADPEDSDYPATDYEGEWLHVNDHGNCTLYVRENGNDTEIWSIV